MHGSFLEKGKLVAKEILGEQIVFGARLRTTNLLH